MTAAESNPIPVGEMTYKMEHAGLYELTHQEFLDLPANTLRQAQAAANQACPICSATHRGVVLAFADLDHIGIEYWIKCSHCEHVRRHG